MKLAILVLVFLVACAPQGQVVIGGLFPLTGGLSSYGEVAKNSALLAVDEINQAGGIGGNTLVLDIQDHQCDPKTAVSAFEQLSAKGITLFTSVACSGTVLSIAPLLEKNNALLVGTIVTSAKITGVSQFVFRNWASDSDEAKLLAKEVEQRGYKTVGTIYEETDYAQGLKISLETFLDGKTKVTGEGFAPGATDVRTQLAKLKEANPDVLFISPQTVTSAELVLKEIEDLQWNPHLLVNDNIIKAVNVLENHKILLEGAIGGDYRVEKSEKFDSFLAKYKKKYGVDCPQQNICAGVYDAVYLLANAAAHGTQNTQVKNYLKSVQYDGASGLIQFDDNNDRVTNGYTLFEVRDGKAVAKN